MKQIEMDVQVRTEIGSQKIRKVRSAKFIPGVVYGEGKTPTCIKADRKIYEGIVRHHRGGNVIFRINIMEGEKKLRDYSAIIKEEQHHPVTEQILHLDFHRISLTEKIEVKVPIVSKGDPIGVKSDGGVLEHVLWELDIVCLPLSIPEKFELDISNLKIGDALHVKDIVLPEGVTSTHDPEGIVFTVKEPMKETVGEAAATSEVPELEVIKEKKKEEGEEGKEKKPEAGAKKPEAAAAKKPEAEKK